MNLNLLGLILNAIGAVLLIFFPPIVRTYTKDGAPVVGWKGNPSARGQKLWLAQALLSRGGLVLLALGFCVQIYAEHSSTQHDSDSSGLKYLACTFIDSKGAPQERAFMISLDGAVVKDAYGEAWQVQTNTPVRLGAIREDTLDGKDVGGVDLVLNRLTGKATFRRLGPKLSPDTPEGWRTVEATEEGRCLLQPRRTIE